MEHEFVVSALKYRPDTFDSVVGQSAITNTLKNAIRNEHLGKAFLFCGPRGVGKTTCARILAKVINCERPTDELDPCGECEPCKSFQEGHSLNIHELDAASNNKVEHIRELIEQVRLAPQVGSYKVYIIDEVHMLSQQAFNAFLKTLEEPPDHAIFILATTEKHKVLPTILSRCQIYDFHRIGISDITDHLEGIAEREGISAEREALHTIAIKADGALRDALSIFDQLVASAGKELSYQHVVDSLNILDHEHFFTITEQLLQGDHAQSLLSFNDILQRGFDGQHFLNGLAQHFRDLLMARDERTLSLLEVGEELQKRFGEQANACEPNDLVDALNTISDADSRYKGSKDQRLLVELTLMKLCRTLGSEEGLKKKKGDEGEEPLSTPSESKNGSSSSSGPSNGAVSGKGEAEGSKAPSQNDTPQEGEKPPQQVKEEVSDEGADPQQETPQEGSQEAPPPVQEEAEEEKPQLEEEEENAGDVKSQEGVESKESEEEVVEGPDLPLEGSAPPKEEPPEEKIEAPAPSEGAAAETAPPATPTKSKPRSKPFKSQTPRISDFEKESTAPSQEAEGTDTIPKERKARNRFDQDSLKKSWNAFLERSEIEGAKQALRKGPPAIKEEEKLELVLESRMEVEWVEHVKDDLLQHLRESLSNHYIELHTLVEQKVNGEKERPYTAKQHFDRMQEKNPKLAELRDRFDLDLDR